MASSPEHLVQVVHHAANVVLLRFSYSRNSSYLRVVSALEEAQIFGTEDSWTSKSFISLRFARLGVVVQIVY